MTAHEELRGLRRMFPHATELAVSRELLDRFIIECVTIHRYEGSPPERIVNCPPVKLRTLTGWITAQRQNLVFRDVRLTLVRDVL